MKRKDIQELHTKTLKELENVLKEKKDSLFKSQIDQSVKKLKNTRFLFQTRKDIARILTVLTIKTRRI